jgi:hypothetical protein
MTAFEVYLWSMADRLHCVYGFFAMVLIPSIIILFLTGGLLWAIPSEGNEKSFAKVVGISVKVAIAGVVLAVLHIVTPTKQDMVAIYFVPKIINNDTVDLLEKAPKALQNFLQQYADDNKPKKGKDTSI